MSEEELVAWLRNNLQAGQWVNHTKPWLWPALRASLPKEGLRPFIDRHSDEFEMREVAHRMRAREVENRYGQARKIAKKLCESEEGALEAGSRIAR